MTSPARPGAEPTPQPDTRQPDTQQPDVDELGGLVLAVPGVHQLHAGALGEVATYLPGRRVNGLKLLDPGCDIHLVVEVGVPLLGTADLVRAAVRPHVDGPIDVTIEDVVPAAPVAEVAADSEGVGAVSTEPGPEPVVGPGADAGGSGPS